MSWTEGQHGYVLLTDWWNAPDGLTYIGMVGMVSILQAKDAVGFSPKSGQDWAAHIVGPTTSVIVFGCQIKGFGQLTPEANLDKAHYWVLP